jgi:hypothetical protein
VAWSILVYLRDILEDPAEMRPKGCIVPLGTSEHPVAGLAGSVKLGVKRYHEILQGELIAVSGVLRLLFDSIGVAENSRCSEQHD